MDLEARFKELEARVQLLEDQEQIRECLSRYSFNADLGRSEEYVNNYTPDGVIDLSPTMKWSGKEQLMDFIGSPTGGHKSIEGRCQHTSMDYFIRVNGNKAWAEGYSVVYLKKGDEYTVFTCGFNHWDFEKRDGRWYLKYRYRRPVGDNEWGGKVIRDYLK
jgi:SnoaL-like protein